MRLKKKVLEKIDGDKILISKLCAALDKAYPTIKKYIYLNHELLTTASALEVLQEHLGMSYEQIIDRSKTHA